MAFKGLILILLSQRIDDEILDYLNLFINMWQQPHMTTQRSKLKQVHTGTN